MRQCCYQVNLIMLFVALSVEQFYYFAMHVAHCYTECVVQKNHVSVLFTFAVVLGSEVED